MSQILPKLLPAACLLLVLIAACDSVEQTAPFEIEAGPRTLYGYLDATSRVQRARVEVRRRDVDFPRSAEEALLRDTEVFSVFVDTLGLGRDTVRWTQRAERLPDGTYAPIFTGMFEPVPLARYRIVVVRQANGPRAESREETEILVPKAGDPFFEPHRLESGGVILPAHWPAAYNARLDTFATQHSSCIFRPDSLLEVPEISRLFPGNRVTISPDSALVGPDTLRVDPDSTVVYGPVTLVVLRPPDTLRIPMAMGDTVRIDRHRLFYGPNTIASYIKSLEPYPFYSSEHVEVVEERGGFTALLNLSGLRREIERRNYITDSHIVRYDYLYVGLRVRDKDWDGQAQVPNTVQAGFLGGVDAAEFLLNAPVPTLRAAGLADPSVKGFGCPGLWPYPEQQLLGRSTRSAGTTSSTTTS